MSARQPQFEVVRTNAEQPWHARFRAANGRIVFTTEQYARKEGARGALTALFRLCDCAFTGYESRVVEVDER